MRKLLWAWFVLIIAMTYAKTAFAQGDEPGVPSDNEVNAVAKQLYCPVCENIPLDVCPTQACSEWRELIRLKLSEGWNVDQIKVYFAEQYGDRVLGAPPPRGLNWLIYILPPVAILIGAFVLFRAVKTWRQPVVEEQSAGLVSATEGDQYIARLEEELRKQ